MMELKGVTWDHPRGYEGLELATKKHLENRPNVNISWDRHSLRDFESHPLPQLADKYDLIVLDHPFMGDASKHQCLLDLSVYNRELELESLSKSFVGSSFQSYQYQGNLWALPVDAASQAAVYRKDLIKEYPIPKTLNEIRQLSNTYKIALALVSVHAFNIFNAICANLGTPPKTDPDEKSEFVDLETGVQALEILKELASYCPPESISWNAIDCLEAMSHRDDLVYAPYVFQYSSYSSPKAYKNTLTFTQIPSIKGNNFEGAVLGGTGIAISNKCKGIEEALSFAKFVTSSQIQLYMGLNNGQPARKDTWENTELNSKFDNFYKNTLSTINHSYVRPRFPGFIRLQNEAGKVIEDFLTESGSSKATMVKVNKIYQKVSKSQNYDGEFI